jgi:hypothetical protein
VVAYVLTQLPVLSKAGISGYTFFSPSFSVGNTTYGVYFVELIMPTLSPTTNSSASLAAAFAPILAHIDAAWPSQFQAVPVLADYPDFNSWWQPNNGPKDAGSDAVIGSWLVDEESLKNATAVELAFKKFTPEGTGATAYLVAGGAVANAVPRGGSNALLPAWRKALLHCSKSSSSPFSRLFSFFLCVVSLNQNAAMDRQKS